MSDLEIIDKLRQRDESSLIDLIDIYGDFIYRASNKVLNNKELSEECLNTVLMKIWDGIEFYDKDIGLFKNWIFTLAKYTAIDMLRKEVKHKSNVTLDKDVKHKNNVEDEVLLKEVISELKEAIKTLNEVDKEIFIERYEKGNRVKDISKKIGISPKALSLRIMRIKNKLGKHS